VGKTTFPVNSSYTTKNSVQVNKCHEMYIENFVDLTLGNSYVPILKFWPLFLNTQDEEPK